MLQRRHSERDGIDHLIIGQSKYVNRMVTRIGDVDPFALPVPGHAGQPWRGMDAVQPHGTEKRTRRFQKLQAIVARIRDDDFPARTACDSKGMHEIGLSIAFAPLVSDEGSRRLEKSKAAPGAVQDDPPSIREDDRPGGQVHRVPARPLKGFPASGRKGKAEHSQKSEDGCDGFHVSLLFRILFESFSMARPAQGVPFGGTQHQRSPARRGMRIVAGSALHHAIQAQGKHDRGSALLETNESLFLSFFESSIRNGCKILHGDKVLHILRMVLDTMADGAGRNQVCPQGGWSRFLLQEGCCFMAVEASTVNRLIHALNFPVHLEGPELFRAMTGEAKSGRAAPGIPPQEKWIRTGLRIGSVNALYSPVVAGKAVDPSSLQGEKSLRSLAALPRNPVRMKTADQVPFRMALQAEAVVIVLESAIRRGFLGQITPVAVSAPSGVEMGALISRSGRARPGIRNFGLPDEQEGKKKDIATKHVSMESSFKLAEPS